MATQTILSKLSFKPAADKAAQNPMEAARMRFVSAVALQVEAAQAFMQGKELQVDAKKKDDSGKIVEYKKTIRPWFWEDEKGDYRVTVRISNKKVQLQDGQDLFVGEKTKLVSTLKTLMEAAEAGELDIKIQGVKKSK